MCTMPCTRVFFALLHTSLDQPVLAWRRDNRYALPTYKRQLILCVFFTKAGIILCTLWCMHGKQLAQLSWAAHLGCLPKCPCAPLNCCMLWYLLWRKVMSGKSHVAPRWYMCLMALIDIRAVETKALHTVYRESKGASWLTT